MKRRTSVYINTELLEYAKKEKLNLSKLLEEAIKFCKIKNKRSILPDSGSGDAGSNPAGATCFTKHKITSPAV